MKLIEFKEGVLNSIHYVIHFYSFDDIRFYVYYQSHTRRNKKSIHDNLGKIALDSTVVEVISEHKNVTLVDTDFWDKMIDIENALSMKYFNEKCIEIDFCDE